MATSLELSPQNVVTALQELSVEKTFELVFHLGVEIKVLDDITLQYRGISRKIHYTQAWLDSDTYSSWEKLISGLKHIGMTVVADNVESTFVATVFTSVPVRSAPVPPTEAAKSPAPPELSEEKGLTHCEKSTSMQQSSSAKEGSTQKSSSSSCSCGHTSVNVYCHCRCVGRCVGRGGEGGGERGRGLEGRR